MPSVYKEFGQILAFTERTVNIVLRDHLAQRGVEPETWYALKLVSVRGPSVPRTLLMRDLEGSRGLNAESTRTLLSKLADVGLIEGSDAIDLTPAGTTLFESLQAYVLDATVGLLGQFDQIDIETTVRTLKAITQRAQEAAAPAA
jgi:hypothetical protein